MLISFRHAKQLRNTPSQVPVYLLAQLRPGFTHLSLFIVTLGVLSCIGATLGLVAGGFSKDFQAARQAVIPTIVPPIVFAGYLIPKDQVSE